MFLPRHKHNRAAI